MLIRIMTLLAVLTMTGCAIVPDAIDVKDDTSLVSYTRAVTSGNAQLGEPARWGGVIVGVENKPQKTFVEVVHFPLNHYGKPNTSAETVGRFKVLIDGFVDPISFEEGRTVTFVGSVGSPTAGMVGEQPYMYPTLNAQDYHLWRKEVAYDVSGIYFNYHTGWYSPYMSPYFHPSWRFHRSRVRVIERGSAPPKSNIGGSDRQSQPVRTYNDPSPSPRRNNRKKVEY